MSHQSHYIYDGVCGCITDMVKVQQSVNRNGNSLEWRTFSTTCTISHVVSSFSGANVEASTQGNRLVGNSDGPNSEAHFDHLSSLWTNYVPFTLSRSLTVTFSFVTSTSLLSKMVPLTCSCGWAHCVCDHFPTFFTLYIRSKTWRRWQYQRWLEPSQPLTYIS